MVYIVLVAAVCTGQLAKIAQLSITVSMCFHVTLTMLYLTSLRNQQCKGYHLITVYMIIDNLETIIFLTMYSLGLFITNECISELYVRDILTSLQTQNTNFEYKTIYAEMFLKVQQAFKKNNVASVFLIYSSVDFSGGYLPDE